MKLTSIFTRFGLLALLMLLLSVLADPTLGIIKVLQLLILR